jgi:hypothetical protein
MWLYLLHCVAILLSSAIFVSACQIRCNVNSETALVIAVANVSCSTIAVEGIISISDNILISRPLMIFGTEEASAIVQSNTNKNGIYIRDVTAGVYVHDLKVDASSAQAAIVVANASNVHITRVYILGSAHIFAIFYAGHDVPAGIPTLRNFDTRLNMDRNNSFTHSIVDSPWSGDSLSFSLQYLGTLHNNTVINGGKIAFYMNANCTCTDNRVYDSISQGIFISSPSVGNTFINNTILRAK